MATYTIEYQGVQEVDAKNVEEAIARLWEKYGIRVEDITSINPDNEN